MWIEELRLAEQLPASYAATVTEYISPLAQRIGDLHASLGRPVVIGINGAQGSGKTTFALFLTECLQRESDLKTVRLSLDDLYLGRQAREALARNRHPLLRTRGVPGTHDVAQGKELLTALTEQSDEHMVKLPVFDKAADDQVPQSEWRNVAAPVDVVLFEGWCVGARPQRDIDLRSPVNALEAEEDADGSWRSFVNSCLKNEYADLFSRLDALVMLRVPSFNKVIEWRQLQEQKLGNGVGMDAAELQRFVMHFERLTRHMLARMPGDAHTTIDLDDLHTMVGAAHKDWPQTQG